jgi:two-component system sensor histidine kinase/response regulator
MIATSALPRVLVVDDEPEHASIVATLLTRRGFEVQIMHSPGDLVERALEQRPALVLLDVFMPTMDGFACATALRRDPRTRTVPILFLTASAEDERVRTRQIELHASVLAKPFHAAELLWAVEVAMARAAQQARP